MTSKKQLVANAQNALKSTGPRTLRGKARSRQNAVKHGLTACQVVLPGEDPKEYEALKNAMFLSLQPDGALENQLVERAASLTWRLRRVPVFENVLFRWAAYVERALYDTDKLDEINQKNDPVHEQNVDQEFEDGLAVGRMFETLLSTDALGRMGRYETTMHNQLMQVLEQLRLNKLARSNVSRIVEREIESKVRSEKMIAKKFGNRFSREP